MLVRVPRGICAFFSPTEIRRINSPEKFSGPQSWPICMKAVPIDAVSHGQHFVLVLGPKLAELAELEAKHWILKFPGLSERRRSPMGPSSSPARTVFYVGRLEFQIGRLLMECSLASPDGPSGA